MDERLVAAYEDDQRREAMILKLRSERQGPDHVRTTYFGKLHEEGTFVNLGTLMQHVGEWQVIGTALLLGADQMGDIHLQVILEGDQQVVQDGLKYYND